MAQKKKKSLMNSKHAFRKIVDYTIYFIVIVSLYQYSSAQNPELFPDQFINSLKNYFAIYFSQIKTEKTIKPKEEVLQNIKEITLEHLAINKEEILGKNNFNDLTVILDEYLKNYREAINIFTINGSDIVNCWLGDLVEEKTYKKDIWGKEIEFAVKVIDNMEIRDFTHYLSAGKEALDVGTRGDTVYYNLEAYRIRANSIWDFFSKREKENRRRRYEPSKANRLRKKFYYNLWLKLYSDCIKDNQNLESAKQRFMDESIILLRENSLFHEAGHIFANRYFNLNDEVKEEMLAFLTELRYGPLPCESLETVVAASYQSVMSDYNLAGKEIISDFITYIRNEQKNKNPDYNDTNIEGRDQLSKMENLFKLTEEQIRSISERIYKNRFN